MHVLKREYPIGYLGDQQISRDFAIMRDMEFEDTWDVKLEDDFITVVYIFARQEDLVLFQLTSSCVQDG